MAGAQERAAGYFFSMPVRMPAFPSGLRRGALPIPRAATTRKVRLGVAGLVLAASTGSVVAGKPTRLIQDLRAGKARTVVVFGTSLTAGGAWVGGLRAWLDAAYPGLATVHNEAGSGQSSVWALRNLARVTRHKPDAVLIEFAMNDAFYPPPPTGFREGVPPETSRANLLRILDSLRAAFPGCEVILQTMNLPLGRSRGLRPNLETYYAGYRKVADSLGLALADHEPVWRSVLAHDTALYVSWIPDSLHPASPGSLAITLPGVIGTLTGATVRLTHPAPQTTHPSGRDLEIRAEAAAPVTRVEFFLGKDRLGVDSTAPYAFTWREAPPGYHLLMARLVRGSTPAAVSTGITVNVTPPTTLAPRKPTRANPSGYPTWAGLPVGLQPDGRRLPGCRGPGQGPGAGSADQQGP